VKLDLSGLEQFRASELLREPTQAGVAPPEMRLDLIDFDPTQPRRSIDEGALAELAASIKAQGVLEPVSLRSHPERPGRYIVNRGERRVRACRLAGLLTVPWFLDERVDPYAQAIENLQREDLSPFDLAQFIADRERDGDSRAEIARKLHKPASFITEAAGLIDAPALVRAAFESGRTRDTRVLYQLARGLREKQPAAEAALQGAGPITRDRLDVAPDAPARDGEVAPWTSTRKVEATKVATALLVEHAGQRGRLALLGHSGKRSGQVHFENGSRATIELTELKLIAWTVR
jgi:ParB family chromosome partitioning protein